ncbi:MAG TPA: 3-phosphoshikimate 1-carboxyvinyltransferase [Chitinophagales bacterium]|nr:3-phosphoshikimate 1-carboxyvinyltransferase [Chitinophagales bacterium]
MWLSHPTRKINTRIRIPGSKSESNRALVLNALTGNKLQIDNLSTARDTQNLLQILTSNDSVADVLDAGTSMRFLTAYYAAANQPKVITGSDRMKERPIAPLVNALSEMGFDVRYKEKEGFPPLEIHPISLSKLDDEVWIEGNISSQFITALLLIAPFLEKGLKIKFTTSLTSRPYIDMTLIMLEKLGVKYEWEENAVSVLSLQSSIDNHQFSIGADWSSASYWYSVAFLADEAEIFLEGLKDDYSQGDREMADWMKRFGVITEFNSEGALIRKTNVGYPTLMKMNFAGNPDLAQTFAAMFAAKNIVCNINGIDSLKIKETDRIAALQAELRKMNVHFEYAPMYEFYQLKGDFKFPAEPVKTYNDHRMAMSFAPLALLGEIEIKNPEVVEKSYPTFWDDMKKAGFAVR